MVQYYRMLQGVSRAEAVFKYLEVIQSLQSYAVHYYEVKVRMVGGGGGGIPGL